ncbi:hypothetical protein JXA47_11985 [Candidatus Sumerlaeota bacterium]|nr:hypothetical protein [Candidatus Sumerlaeota bacterium]
MRLDIRAFALTCGLLMGIGIFLVTWWVILIEGATGSPTMLGRVYRGYSLSAMGSVIGLIYAFINGVVAGGIFAGVYNCLAGSSSDAGSPGSTAG